MGVQGIVPFLLKKCPQIIENIPNRFHALEGKTIALDGTLVTQRLHFTPDPRPYRHILGWYQLIAELRQHNIKVICVFDGKHRIPAKLHELQRRRRMRLQAQVRGAWEKSRHGRLLSLTEALQSLESLPEDHQKEVLDDLRDQVEQPQPPGLEDEQSDTILVLDPPAAVTRQDDLAAPAQPISGHFPEPILPVEEPVVLEPDVASSAPISTSSTTTEEISVPQGLSDAESPYLVSPSSVVDERSIVQDLPPSDDALRENTSEQDEPLPERIAPSPNDQTIPPDETRPTKDESLPNPLESHAAPKVSEPTTLRDASSSPAQPSDLVLSKDSAVSEPEHGGDETTMGKPASPVNQGVDFISPSASVEQAILVLDPSAAVTQRGDATPAQPIVGHSPEPLLPVEEPVVLEPDAASSAPISTSSTTTEEISVSQGLSDAESSYLASSSSVVDERSIVQDLPPSDDDTPQESTSEQDEPSPSDQTVSPDETWPIKDEPVPSPLESHAAPKVSEPTTLRDASSLPAQPSDLALSKDSTVSEPEHGGDETTMGRPANPVKQGVDFISQSPPSLETKSELDLPAGVNDNQYLSKVIRHLHDHYTRTSTTGADGIIHAWSEEPDATNLPDIPISRVQLKYTQEESKLWEQLVPTSGDTPVDIARVVEQVKELASVELPQDEPEPELEPEPEPAEQEEAEQAAEQEEDETAPISEWAATLEEQSGLMAASLIRRAHPPTTVTYTESRLILEAMGVPCLESPMNYEAEALASSIVVSGLADFVGSEDTDVLMYNAPLLRHMTNKKVPLQVIPPSTETGLGLSRSAFVDAAILMGTDFVRRLKKIGPVTAYRLMEKYGSIERMLEAEHKFRPPDVADYLEQVKVARLIFSSLPPAPLPESIAQGDWDEQAVQETLAHFGLERYIEEEVISDALSDNYFVEETKETS